VNGSLGLRLGADLPKPPLVLLLFLPVDFAWSDDAE
jgi:hypothetical protein